MVHFLTKVTPLHNLLATALRMEYMLSTNGVSSQYDVRELTCRRLYDVIESNVWSLKSLDVMAESYGSLMSSVLMSKLSPELRLVASRRFGAMDTWDFTACPVKR